MYNLSLNPEIMAPHSRGGSFRSRSFAAAVPPILDSFLENLPHPNSPISDQQTPTGPVANDDRDVQAATPTRVSRFEIPDEDDEEEEEDDDDATLDEREFQSHYSRQNTTPSEPSDEGSEDDTGPNFPQQHSPNLQRVSSLPVSSALNNLPNGHPGSLHTSASTTSLPPPIPPPLPLYPPYYNRPPTPLPPSPSLTSLLRPPSLLTRSTQSTRPTTPDSSDVETPNDTEAAVFHSARRAQPLAPSQPKIPTYEYYGFVLYLASSLAFALYILWSYLPSPFLHGMGVRYYPNRWWSIAIPAWIVMLIIFIYVALLSYNVEYLTLPMNSIECIVDDAANVAVMDERGRVRSGGSKRLEKEFREERRRKGKGSIGKGKRAKREKDRRRSDGENRGTASVTGAGPGEGDLYVVPSLPPGVTWRQVWNEGTDGVMDVPLGGVCEVLYGERRDFHPP